MERYNTNWSISQLVRYTDLGKATFENPIQRGFVWNLYRKSLLIHSILYGYPIPALYFKIIRGPEDPEAKKKKKASADVYDNFDGKQRSRAIYEYVKDQYAIIDHIDITPIPDEEGNGDPLDIRGLKFSELPVWAQERITSFSLTIYYFDKMTDEEMRDFFRRLNNGQPLRAIEITRVQTPHLSIFQTLAHHKAIQNITTKAGRKAFSDENVAMQICNICTENTPDFSTTQFRLWAKTVEISQEVLLDINNALDVLYDIMMACDDKKILKTLKKRTHFISAAYACYIGKQKNKSNKDLQQALFNFFNGSPSVSDEYNDSVGAGSAKPTNITTRKEIMLELVEGLQNDVIDSPVDQHESEE